MALAYRRTVAASIAPGHSALAPLLSVFGHVIILALFFSASFAVRETPRFEDFDLMGFSGGEVVEAELAMPAELAEIDDTPSATALEDEVHLAEPVEEYAALAETLEVDAPLDVADAALIEAAREPPLAAVADSIAAETQAVAAVDPVEAPPSLQPAALQQAVEPELPMPAEAATTRLAAEPYPLAEQLVAESVPLQETAEVIAPVAAEEPVEMASLVMQDATPAAEAPARVEEQRSESPPSERWDYAALPRTAADRQLAKTSPELWAVVSALRAQVARCWAGTEGPGDVPDFIDVEVAFDRAGRLDMARVQDAGRLLRDEAFGREAGRARQALQACSPFALPSEHYGLWQRFTMRFIMSPS